MRWPAERRRAQRLLDEFGIRARPTAQVSDVSAVTRAMVAIVRAYEELRHGAHGPRTGGLLVLDEPIVFLPEQGVDQLFSLVRAVAKAGTAVLFVSHDIDEVLEITDRVTVLRDGRASCSGPSSGAVCQATPSSSRAKPA